MPRSRFSRSAPLSAHIAWIGRRALVRLAGELDLGTLPTAQRALAEAEAAGAIGLILDLRDVDFLDASGLRLVYHAHDRWGDDLETTEGSEAVEGLLSFSGLGPRLSRRA